MSPETEYQLRAIYNGNETTAIYTALTTEAAAQVGNSGFEEWHEWDYYVNKTGLFWGDDVYQTNYAPYSENGERWWDSNNSVTTPSDRTNTGASFKSFPMVTYTEGHNGGKAAQIMAIAVNNANTSGTSLSNATPGEIFIGTYNGDRKHAFNSRPSKFGFWYRYTPRFDGSHSTDTFRAYISIMNNGNVIAERTFEYTASQNVADWTYVEMEIEYQNVEQKATDIYIQFLQSTASAPTYTLNVGITYAGKSANVHGGSILTVDDLQLIYE